MILTLSHVRNKGMVPCNILDQYLIKYMTGYGNNEALKPLT